MNIAKFGFSGGDTASRLGTGTVPASGGDMFGDTLPFRLQLASSTAKLATVDGMAAAPVDGAVAAFRGFGSFELTDLPERIAFADAEDDAAEQPNFEGAESSELAPTLALLAPIVDAPARNDAAIGAGHSTVRAASSTTAMIAGEPGDGDLEAQVPAATRTTEEALADPDGDMVAMLRRVRAAGTATDRASVQSIATIAENAPADVAPRLDQVQGLGVQTRAAALEMARVRPAATSAEFRTAEAPISPDGELPVAATESAARVIEPRMGASSIADLRVGGNMRQPGDVTISRVRGTAAAERSMTSGDTSGVDYELDVSTTRSATVEDTPLARQVTAPATEMRAGQAAPFAVNLAAASGADQPSAEAGTRTEAAQTIPLDQRFGERLGAMVGTAMGNATLKDGMLRLQVTPDHLGPIEIEMDTSGASERLQITVENEAVRQAIAQAHARIEQELRQAGAKLAGIDVALRDAGGDAQGNAQTNSQADTDGRRPGSAISHETGPAGADGSDLIDDRFAPRPGQPGNILYA